MSKAALVHLGVSATLLLGAGAGCLRPQGLSLPTRLPADACPELRAAGEQRGWAVADATSCATLELPGQGRLVFQAPNRGVVELTLLPPERKLHLNQIARQRALLQSEAEIIVSLAEKARGYDRTNTTLSE